MSARVTGTGRDAGRRENDAALRQRDDEQSDRATAAAAKADDHRPRAGPRDREPEAEARLRLGRGAHELERPRDVDVGIWHREQARDGQGVLRHGLESRLALGAGLQVASVRPRPGVRIVDHPAKCSVIQMCHE